MRTPNLSNYKQLYASVRQVYVSLRKSTPVYTQQYATLRDSMLRSQNVFLETGAFWRRVT